jgi:uncharacterized protein YndB with AHSA1/START domain
MTRLVTEVVIAAAPATVWGIVSDLAAQPDWMHDAKDIRFASAARTGVGVVMHCDTAIGPIKLTDTLVVAAWEEGREIAIRHSGAVSGTGRFTLQPDPAGTRFRWQEDLHFPWWLGGLLAGMVARPVLAATWRRDLASLKALAEDREC